MKFSLEWLRYFLETEASAAEIAAALNRIGIEVEDIEDPAEKLAGFRVARVLTVSTGDGDPLQVVCGAPNARAGMKGVLGLPGARIWCAADNLQRITVAGGDGQHLQLVGIGVRRGG